MNGLIVILGWVAAGIVGLILHELGHVIAAWALGYKVVEIRIGSGDAILQCEIGQASVVIGQAPVNGLVRAIPPVADSSIAALLFTAAGPLVDVVLILAYVNISDTFGPTSHIDAAMFGGILAQAMGLFLNLWPRTMISTGAHLPNDGLALWNILTGKTKRLKRAKQKEMMEAYPVQGVSTAVSPDLSQNAIYLIAKLAIVSDAERARLIDALADEVDNLRPSSGKLYVLDMLVTHCLSQAPRTYLEKLDLWSHRALELNPERATLRGSRGAVLIELGRYDEGLEMLAHAEHGNAFDRCINEAYRALAFLRQGDLPQANAAFESAKNESRAVDPNVAFASIILERVGGEIAKQDVLVVV